MVDRVEVIIKKLSFNTFSTSEYFDLIRDFGEPTPVPVPNCEFILIFFYFVCEVLSIVMTSSLEEHKFK